MHQLINRLQKEAPLATTNALVKGAEQLHPVLSSMTLSFWRMRLLVERKAKTPPLKLLILQTIGKEEGISPGEICQRFGLDSSRISRLIRSLERGAAASRASYKRPPVFASASDKRGREYLPEQTVLVNKELHERLLLAGLNPEEVSELERVLGVAGEAMRCRCESH